jgi:quinol-cytochrome oxidoreductase complex cytochrome b subunit
MLKTERLQNLRQKFAVALDQRVRAITAGLGLNEIRAVLRGDPPTEKPNPRYKVHTTSFLFHIRPRYYEKGATLFTNTFRLGFFTSFFFFVELFTGLILMIYYVPSVEGAYGSILELMSNVPYGKFLRDMHRLGAEGMVIFTALHMLRTYLTGSYKKERSFTWLTGAILLFITLILSFSGYLLPWDQLAYWAVTIGTSMADAAPIGGREVNLLLRGAPDIGAGGLLRFYLLHVVLLPLAAILLISIHYYKVGREHGISLPPNLEEGNITPQVKKEAKQRVDFIPDLLTHEVFLTALGLFALTLGIIFFYAGAPLETHANPQVTPLDTKAPWYFWWLQGLLKIDPAAIFENLASRVGLSIELSQLLPSKIIMGLIIPPLMFVVLMLVPYIDRNPHRALYKRPWAIGIGLASVLLLVVLSYMGTPQYAIETPAATRIVQDLAPEEGEGILREIPYDQLVPGTYEVNVTPTEGLCPDMDFGCPQLEEVFEVYTERINLAQEEGDLPNVEAFFIIEDWQEGLRKVTTRILWDDPETSDEKIYERHIFLHRDREH